MVLNIINFNQENLDDFYQSSFYKKNQKLLMFFYLYDDEVLNKDYFIQDFIYHDLKEIPWHDLEIIKNDWKIIVKKIKEGKAHELSERLTRYLGACPKGNKRDTSLVAQPFSSVKAMQRAYSFKPHYLKYLLMKQEYNKKLIKLDIKKNDDIVSFILKRVYPFINFNVRELCEKFKIDYKAKQKHYLILTKIFDTKSFNHVEELLKENIKIRTYTIKSNDVIQEDFPFMVVNPYEFEYNSEISFYDSELYNYFINTKFIFIGFKKNENNNTYISKLSYFEFPEEDIKKLEHLWNDTKQKFRGDLIVRCKKNKKGNIKISNNLISKKEGHIGHIRPRAQDKNNRYLIPCGQEITRQCYWLNKEFVQQHFRDLTEELN